MDSQVIEIQDMLAKINKRIKERSNQRSIGTKLMKYAKINKFLA